MVHKRLLSLIIAVLALNSHANAKTDSSERTESEPGLDSTGKISQSETQRLRSQLMQVLIDGNVYGYANAYAYVSTLTDEQIVALSEILNNSKVKTARDVATSGGQRLK